jgi:uncharacterized protein (DUF2164 family)
MTIEGTLQLILEKLGELTDEMNFQIQTLNCKIDTIQNNIGEYEHDYGLGKPVTNIVTKVATLGEKLDKIEKIVEGTQDVIGKYEEYDPAFDKTVVERLYDVETTVEGLQS